MVKAKKKNKIKEIYKKSRSFGIDKSEQEIFDKEETKKVLLLTEYEVSNYSTKKVQKQLIENKNQNKEIIVASTSQSPNRKSKLKDINSSIWALLAKNSMGLSNCKIKAKVNSILWNVLIYTRAFFIKKVLEFYRKVLIHRVMSVEEPKLCT
ncbi:3728_t:CDS:2 [Gigaspora margarita]|uniref:3728_t:CDS:1 n=1 Tax=Gigaspora margarita TaxID=4874 RepID=A0ABN7V029_GIGMA|nr:3728_t:CDS:2 [Gigaspora margarita]